MSSCHMDCYHYAVLPLQELYLYDVALFSYAMTAVLPVQELFTSTT